MTHITQWTDTHDHTNFFASKKPFKCLICHIPVHRSTNICPMDHQSTREFVDSDVCRNRSSLQSECIYRHHTHRYRWYACSLLIWSTWSNNCLTLSCNSFNLSFAATYSYLVCLPLVYHPPVDNPVCVLLLEYPNALSTVLRWTTQYCLNTDKWHVLQGCAMWMWIDPRPCRVWIESPVMNESTPPTSNPLFHSAFDCLPMYLSPTLSSGSLTSTCIPIFG